MPSDRLISRLNAQLLRLQVQNAHLKSYSTHATRRKISAVIYDLDGTLLDTEKLAVRAVNTIVRDARTRDTSAGDTPQRTSNWSWADHARIIGTKKEFWSKLVIKEFGLEGLIDEEGVVEGFERDLALGYSSVGALPGVQSLIETMTQARIPQAIATSSTAKAVAKKREAHEWLFKPMQHILTGDQVTHGKPHPEIFLKAAEALGVPPQECLVFEDSPAGVAAAIAAGMGCVAIPDARIVAMQGEHNSFSCATSRVIINKGLRQGFSKATLLVETLEGISTSVSDLQSTDARYLGGHFSFPGASA